MTNPLKTRFARAATAIAWRQLHVMFRSRRDPARRCSCRCSSSPPSPAASRRSAGPGFDYPNYTTFQFVFVLLQSAVFGGVFTGFSIAADFEYGFARRLLLAHAHRSAIDRRLRDHRADPHALLTWTVVTVVALASGRRDRAGRSPTSSAILLIAADAQLRPHCCSPPAWRCGSAPCRRRR